ncbi:MAG TPA: c-type cytochrome, partial [Longimicrobiales bacterium]|nr:c-type cytochrome [Longimicrobiales bacterium]
REPGGGAMRARHLGVIVFPAIVLIVLGALSGGETARAAQQAADGSAVFAQQCARCHGNQGEGALEGPSLHALLDTQEAVAGVAGIVRSGYGEMPAFADELSEAQIQAVADYVISQFGTSGDVPEGGALYRLNCAGCHGAATRGGALIYSDHNAPHLLDAPTPDVAAAVRSGPGTMPAFNEGALTDAQLASISAYVAVLESPPRPGGVEVRYHGPVTEGFIAIVGGLGAAIAAALWMERGGRG